jgi:N utilization substance protein A
VRKLFALEVPEIADGTVEIAAIAREAGHRTKIAVRSRKPGVNAKGACIGPLGSRVRNIMHELHGEKIDIVDWAEDPAAFVGHALSPARVNSVEVIDLEGRVARVIVPDYQLSLAIGKEGQNARLAARLTGWRIDIRPDTEAGAQGSAGQHAAGQGSGAQNASAQNASGQGSGAQSPGDRNSGAQSPAGVDPAGTDPADPVKSGSSAESPETAETSGGHAPGAADASAR